jgi:hypothetical protein
MTMAEIVPRVRLIGESVHTVPSCNEPTRAGDEWDSEDGCRVRASAG